MCIGNIFTIEPVIVEGSEDSYEWSDQWTAVTKDGGRAAQFEETILITSEGAEILTQHNNEDYIEPIVHHG